MVEGEAWSPQAGLTDHYIPGVRGAPFMCSVTTRPLRPGPMDSGMAHEDQSPRARISTEGLSYGQLRTGGYRPMLALPHLC